MHVHASDILPTFCVLEMTKRKNLKSWLQLSFWNLNIIYLKKILIRNDDDCTQKRYTN